MKKLFTSLCILCIGFTTLAQVEVAPNLYDLKPEGGNENKTSMTNCSSWTVQMDYPATTITGAGGLAGVIQIDSVFWVSQWSSSNIYLLDTAGNYISQFTVAGVTGARSLTYDGQFVYAGAATNFIYKIDPATQTLVGTITLPTNFAVRHCAYDSSANSGAGGFWVGNWNTNIVLVDMAGTRLDSILAATHGMAAMYGSTIDYVTPGGPYLWVFDQSQSTSSAVIVQLDLATGNPTGVTHDVASDVGFGQANPLAGGMFFSNTLKGGKNLLCGLLQGNGNVFGYELDTTAFIDLSLERAYLTAGYGNIPDRNLVGVATDISVDFNNRSCTDSTLNATLMVEVEHLGIMVYNDSVALNNIPSPTTMTYDFTGYQASSFGQYNVRAYLSHYEMGDINRVNDTVYFSFEVTDSVYSRDNDFVGGSLGLPDGFEGLLGQVYKMSVDQAVYSVDVLLRSPTDGDSIRIEVYDFVAGGDPTTRVYKSPAQTIQGDTAQWIRFETNLNLFEASYFIGVRQFQDNISLATSEAFWVPGVSYYYFETSQSWTLVENGGFSISYFIRPNVGDLIVAPDTTDGISKNSFSNVKLYPNPANDNVFLSGLENVNSVLLLNSKGQMIYRDDNVINSTMNLDVSEFPQGIYQIVMSGKEGVITRKLSIE